MKISYRIRKSYFVKYVKVNTYRYYTIVLGHIVYKLNTVFDFSVKSILVVNDALSVKSAFYTLPDTKSHLYKL